MEIDINQKKRSTGDNYQIFTDGQQTHYTSSQLFQLLPQINLYDNRANRPGITIKKCFSWIKQQYDIRRWDNSILQFRTKSIWKLHYQCQSGFDRYDIYGHGGKRHSIYKNNIQVAWWDQKAVTWFAGDNYKIIADNDCDVTLLISFCLILDDFSKNHDNKTVRYKFGNIGFQARRFDKNWKAQ